MTASRIRKISTIKYSRVPVSDDLSSRTINEMLTIRIPSKFPILGACENRDLPRIENGSFYVFDVTDEEYMFWNGLETSEREKFVESSSRECFFEALHSFMRTSRPENYLTGSEYALH